MIEYIVPLLSAVVSVVAAFIAYRSLTEQRRVTYWSVNYSRLLDAEKMMWNYPELLKLHGVTDELLKECDATPQEVIYLLISLRAGQESWRLDPKIEGKLSPYRQQMLNNPKVALVWEKILYKKLIFRTKFAHDVNKYYLDKE
ncbi:MAG: hypothetical protein D3925_12150 [Candidatus Electrothrix sp. AR5]|nr:hypothetical protein [Candidatus Electrothrix sp. AR5]